MTSAVSSHMRGLGKIVRAMFSKGGLPDRGLSKVRIGFAAVAIPLVVSFNYAAHTYYQFMMERGKVVSCLEARPAGEKDHFCVIKRRSDGIKFGSLASALETIPPG